jgi:hypothetical protein
MIKYRLQNLCQIVASVVQKIDESIDMTVLYYMDETIDMTRVVV